MNKIRIFWKLLKLATEEFFNDNALRLSASLSYYTIFSIAPLLIIVVSMAGIFFGNDAVQGKIYGQINGFVGITTSLEIQEIIKNVKAARNNGGGAVIGFVILIFGASGVFTEIQDSINYIWSVRAKPRTGWVKFLINRTLSFSLITAFGFLLLVSLLINAVMDLLNDRLTIALPHLTVYLFNALSLLLTFAIISCLFAIIFKVLPDVIVRWRHAFVGAFFTSLLFMGGKFLISFYLRVSNIGDMYGAAATIIIVLLWVYYSSIILFYGAEFTKTYVIHHEGKITPKGRAVLVVKHEVKEVETSQ